MSSPSQPQPKQDQVIPHPVPGLNELAPRMAHGQLIEGEIQDLWPDFTMRMEQHALLVIVERKHFGSNGALSINKPPQSLKRQLEEVSPLCKHYMHHVDPDQPKNPWELALYQAPIERPALTLEDYQEADWETISQRIYYDQRFRTNPQLDTVYPMDEELQKCLQRDRHSCRVTELTDQIMLFSFIPLRWNDSVANNNATGNLEESSRALANVNLMRHILSVRELGRSHMAWNMICVHKDLFKALSRAWCGFRYEETVPHTDPNSVRVVLRFYWMPRLPARVNQKTDAIIMEDLAASFNNFVAAGCPRPTTVYYPKECVGPEKSGDRIHLVTRKEDEESLKSAVKVHWACVVYTALCGAAGRPEILIGMDQSDGSLQFPDEIVAQALAFDATTVKRTSVGDRSSDQSSGAPTIFSSTGRRTGTDPSASGSSRGERSSK